MLVGFCCEFQSLQNNVCHFDFAIRPSSTVCCLESLERLLILLPESQSSRKSICCSRFAFKAPQAPFPTLTLWPDSEKRTSAVWILWPESQGPQKIYCCSHFAFKAPSSTVSCFDVVARRPPKHFVLVGICGQTPCSFGISLFFLELFCGVKMAASAHLSLVSRSSIKPATENASSRPAMHRMCSFGISHFFRTFLRCQNGCFCAFIACVSVFNRNCHRKCKLQACNAPIVQFRHNRPFFRTFLILLFQASGTQTRQLTVFFTGKQGGSVRIMNCVAGTTSDCLPAVSKHVLLVLVVVVVLAHRSMGICEQTLNF